MERIYYPRQKSSEKSSQITNSFFEKKKRMEKEGVRKDCVSEVETDDVSLRNLSLSSAADKSLVSLQSATASSASSSKSFSSLFLPFLLPSLPSFLLFPYRSVSVQKLRLMFSWAGSLSPLLRNQSLRLQPKQFQKVSEQRA
jgi:hypothetical protein